MPTKVKDHPKTSASFTVIDAKKAKVIVGFKVVDKAPEGKKAFKFIDGDGVKKLFILEKNSVNRPFKIGTAQGYADQFFAEIWAGQSNHPSETANSDAWSTDWNGNVVSCAHRCVGLILAQAKLDILRANDSEQVEDKPEKFEVLALVVKNLDPACADTVDIGKPRTLGDILFRADVFSNGEALKESVKEKLSRELGVAARLVWLRQNGSRVAGGKKLPPAGLVQFLDEHPLLKDCILHIYNEDGGGGQEGSKIGRYISLGYAAAMMYLAATRHLDRGKYEAGEVNFDRKPKGWGRAEDFWTMFSQLSARSIGNEGVEPIAALNVVLEKNIKPKDGNKFSRDALCVLVTRAFLSWEGESDGKWDNARSLKTKLYHGGDEDEGKIDFLRFGGLDLHKEELEANGWLAPEEKLEIVVKSVGDWKIDDPVWVEQDNGEIFFGTILEFSSDSQTASVLCKDDNETYGVKTEWFRADKPEPKEEPEEVEAAE